MLKPDVRHDYDHAKLPFSVWCDLPQPILYELSDDRFQLMDRTPPSPFMAGPGYLLIEAALADFLRERDVARVRLEPTVLFDPAFGEERHEHVRVRIGQFFVPDQIHDLALDGPRMLTMNDEYCFVSEELMMSLRAAGFEYLQFDWGLSRFG